MIRRSFLEECNHMDNIRINLISAIHRYYIKYEKLDEILAKVPGAFYSAPVNVYIDVHDVIKNLLTKNDVYMEHPFALVEGILNMVAHYKNYFSTRKHVQSVFYLINAIDSCGNRQKHLRMFGDKRFAAADDFKKMWQNYSDQCNMVKIIAAYLPNVFYIERTVDFSTVIQDMYMSEWEQKKGFVLSRDKLALQLPAFNNELVLLSPVKYNGEDRSKCISPFDVLRAYYEKINHPDRLSKLSKLSPRMIYLFMALGGIPEYNLPRAFNNGTITDMLYDGIVQNKILNDYMGDPIYIYRNLERVGTKLSIENFEALVRTVDPIHHVLLYRNMPEFLDKTWYIYLNNPGAVDELNRHYFKDHPLDILNLLR